MRRRGRSTSRSTPTLRRKSTPSKRSSSPSLRSPSPALRSPSPGLRSPSPPPATSASASRSPSNSPSLSPTRGRRRRAPPAQDEPVGTYQALLLLTCVAIMTGAAGLWLVPLAAATAVMCHVETAGRHGPPKWFARFLTKTLGFSDARKPPLWEVFAGFALLLAAATAVVFAAARWHIAPLQPAGYYRHSNATLCEDLNLLTASVGTAATAEGCWGGLPVDILPRGWVAGCLELNCTVSLSDEPWLPGTVGSAVLMRNRRDAADPLHFTVVIRGTETPPQWNDDCLTSETPFFSGNRFTSSRAAGYVPYGAARESSTISDAALARLFEELAPGQLPSDITLTVLGHSLGTQIAQLFAVRAAAMGVHIHRVVLASMPRIGGAGMQEVLRRYLGEPGQVVQMISSLDIVANDPAIGSWDFSPFETYLVTYTDACMSCLNEMWLPERCKTVCVDDVLEPGRAWLARFAPQAAQAWVDQASAAIPRYVGPAVDGGEALRHAASSYARIVCPAAGMEPLLFTHAGGTCESGPPEGMWEGGFFTGM